MFRSVGMFFRPATVAIVGASDAGGGGWSRRLYENLELEDFPVRPYLVNPGRQELWGRKVYPDFSSLPERIDLATVIIPAEAVPDTLEEAAAAGLGSALVFAARFGEGDDREGAARAERLRTLCTETGLRICGPNCMGAVFLPERLLLYPSPRVRGLPQGPVGVVFQSGGTFQFWLEQGAARGLGYSYAVSSGNELDLDLADIIKFLVDDPHTSVIVCMVEGVRRGDALMQACGEALEAGKPVLMLKLGRTDAAAEAARSHTGALATDDRIFDAVCRKYGIIRVESLDEMVEAALAFSAGRLPAGPRAAMVGFSGGAKGLFIDYAADVGLPLPQFAPETRSRLRERIDPGVAPDNPLDAGAGLARRHEAFAALCRVAVADENIDMISVQGQVPLREGMEGDPDLFRSIRDATEKPVVAHGRMSQAINEFGRVYQKKAGIPFLQGLPEVARVLSALARYSETRNRGLKSVNWPKLPATNPIEDVLADHGIIFPSSRFVSNAEQAGAAAAAIDGPVAIKLISPDAVHKTDVGAVALNISDPGKASQSAAEMEASLRKQGKHVRVDGFLVQEMVSGLEVIVGIRDDPQFGPVLALGLGGILVEVIADVVFRLLPVDTEDVAGMLEEWNGRKLLDANRGRPAHDREALIRAVIGISEAYGYIRDRFSDLEINPLMVGAQGEGVWAVDVRAISRGPGDDRI